ncbi:MAG: hypothetical protein AAFQ09_01800 [Pseudomonadota bacterium]
MKRILSVVALFGLSACMGGGDSSSSGPSVDLTPDAPDVAMNMQFETLLNGMRMGNDVTYDSDIGRAVQDHANDMFERDYLSVSIQGDPMNRDIGDLVTAAGYTWSEILQLVEQGEFTLDEVLAEFDNTGACGGGGQDLCIDDELFENFGIAKAGSGSDQKWVLVLASPG